MSNTREHILEQALKLFMQYGYHEVTMQTIVQATGLSKGAFYHYFSSKEKVFEEVIESFFNHSPAKDLSADSQDSLWAFCQAYINQVSLRVQSYNDQTGDESGILRANQYVLLFDAMKLLPKFRQQQQYVQEQELKLWSDVIRRAKESGEICSAMTDMQIGRLFIYQNYGIGVYHVLRTQIHELTAELSTQFKIIYDSLRLNPANKQ